MARGRARNEIEKALAITSRARMLKHQEFFATNVSFTNR
jgi:hypothetical protein